MAYLNVRERRIEAKIAYVGPELAGKTTNFERLCKTTQDARIGRVDASAADGHDLLSIAWQPPERARFRDCDVLVRVVAQKAVASPARFDDVLGDVDGVVLVVDARPAAGAGNRDSLAAVREALGRAERPAVPIVIQVNKTDLPDALPAADVLTAMDGGALPHVAASATRGDGVVDTLEAALDQVMASMQAEGDPSQAAERARQAAAGAPNRGLDGVGHPLLAALRQVLRDTVREHVAELEGRLTAAMGRAPASQARGDGDAELRAVVADLAARVSELSACVAALTERSHRAFDDLRDVAPGLSAVCVALNQQAARTEDGLRGLRREMTGLASCDQVAAVHTRVSDLTKELSAQAHRPQP